ncbi:MAG: mraW [Acidimicrobiales bacterium]|nr:mraW [Acidimicrobiales bacterium]
MRTLLVDPVTEPVPFDHVPVLEALVVELFSAVPAGTIVDATLGGAGHAAAVLDSRPDLSVLGLDRDPNALVAAQARLALYGSRAAAVRARFDQMATVVAEAGTAIQPIVGVLFDLGVSSPQFDQADRGFSYRNDAPLDMRMDPTSGMSAADVVNEASVGELADILRRNADERFAGRIARAIEAARPITTTRELAEVVVSAIPAPARRRGGYPAKRTFQALRIHVNDELTVLPPALDAAISILAPGGRLVVISYHSGEDRIVKERLRRADDGGCTCPPGLPCACGAEPEARLLKRGGWTPDAVEVDRNPRAASARLRAVEKLPARTLEDPS